MPNPYVALPNWLLAQSSAALVLKPQLLHVPGPLVEMCSMAHSAGSLWLAGLDLLPPGIHMAGTAGSWQPCWLLPNDASASAETLADLCDQGLYKNASLAWVVALPGASLKVPSIQQIRDCSSQHHLVSSSPICRWLSYQEPASDTPLHGSIVQRLQRFGTYGRIKQVALRAVAHHIATDSQLVAELREVFQELDKEQAGKVHYHDVVEVSLGVRHVVWTHGHAGHCDAALIGCGPQFMSACQTSTGKVYHQNGVVEVKVSQ